MNFADSTLVMQGGYHVLTRDEIVVGLPRQPVEPMVVPKGTGAFWDILTAGVLPRM